MCAWHICSMTEVTYTQQRLASRGIWSVQPHPGGILFLSATGKRLESYPHIHTPDVQTTGSSFCVPTE